MSTSLALELFSSFLVAYIALWFIALRRSAPLQDSGDHGPVWSTSTSSRPASTS